MKMHLPNARQNSGTGKTKTIRTPCAFCFNDPKRKLRQLFFRISRTESRKIEIHDAFRFSCELFCHQRLPASYRSPVDVTLRFAVNVWAYSCEIVALPKIRQWPAVVPSHEAQRKPQLACRLGINNVGLRRRKFLQETNETQRISTR